MALGQDRVIEVVGRVVHHPDPFHDAARAQVVGHGHRDDLVELQLLEPERQDGPRSFGGVAPAPVFGRQPPADLHARREGSLESGNRQADGSRERRNVGDLYGPQSETVPIEVRLDTGDQRVASVPRQRGRQIPHHLRVGVHGGERGPVSRDPSPEPQPLGSKFSRPGHGMPRTAYACGRK